MPNGYLQPGQRVADQMETNFQAGVAVNGQLNVAGGQLICSNVPIGSVALASMGTNTTDIAGQLWITEIMVPYNRIVKNVSILSGGTATTDNWIAAIYDSYGILIAFAGLASGQVLSGANTWQTQAITSVYARGTAHATPSSQVQLFGPQQYFVALQGNGTAAGAFQTVPAPYQICAGVLAGTFGSVPITITPPTTFTAAKAPFVYLS